MARNRNKWLFSKRDNDWKPMHMLRDNETESEYTREEIRLKEGFVCEQCGRSVLAYRQPYSCEEHDEI